MKQLLYKIVYSPNINRIFRNLNKALKPLFPKRFRISPSGTLTLRNEAGKSIKLSTNQTNYLTHLIFWKGYQNFEYTSIFVQLIKKVSVFYDIGANIGFYSLLAAMENEKIKVVGFEPAEGPLFYFKKNVALNHFEPNITVESLALSHTKGEITFYEIKNKKYTYLEHNLAGESNAGSKTTGRDFVPNTVKTTTLDSYVQETSKHTIDLIKMDTEGTENLILEHASYVLSQMQPIIICETLFNTIEAELEKILLTYGYEFYNHTEKGLEKVASITRTQDNGVYNCFFVHPNKYALI